MLSLILKPKFLIISRPLLIELDEPGYQGSGGYAPSNGPPIPTGGHYGNAGYHQPRPVQSGYGSAGAHAVAGAYGSSGGQVNGGY